MPFSKGKFKVLGMACTAFSEKKILILEVGKQFLPHTCSQHWVDLEILWSCEQSGFSIYVIVHVAVFTHMLTQVMRFRSGPSHASSKGRPLTFTGQPSRTGPSPSVSLLEELPYSTCPPLYRLTVYESVNRKHILFPFVFQNTCKVWKVLCRLELNEWVNLLICTLLTSQEMNLPP